jgi:hypothetical protein
MFRRYKVLGARCIRIQRYLFFRVLISAAASLAVVVPANSQPNPAPDAKTMNFDLWCQGQAALPPERCDKRTPEDERAFEVFQAKLERFDVPNRSAQFDQGRVNRDIMNTDPVDNSQKDNLGAQRQYPDISVTPPTKN